MRNRKYYPGKNWPKQNGQNGIIHQLLALLTNFFYQSYGKETV